MRSLFSARMLVLPCLQQFSAKCRVTKVFPACALLTTVGWREQELCIMPCTEEAYKEEPLNPYNGAAINGVGRDFVEQIPRLSKDPHFVSVAR